MLVGTVPTMDHDSITLMAPHPAVPPILRCQHLFFSQQDSSPGLLTVHPSNAVIPSNPAHGYEEAEVLSSSVVMFGYSPDPTLVYGQEATDKVILRSGSAHI